MKRDSKGKFIKGSKPSAKTIKAIVKALKLRVDPSLKKEFSCANCDCKFIDFISNKRKFCSKSCSGKTTKNASGMRHSLITKRKISASFKKQYRKEFHWKWKKDRTLLAQSEKKHLDGRYREWMFSVKNRDGWKCRISNDGCSGRLEAHHILPWRSHPELRYEINNGITLCHYHHPRKREEEKTLSPYFSSLVNKVF